MKMFFCVCFINREAVMLRDLIFKIQMQATDLNLEKQQHLATCL